MVLKKVNKLFDMKKIWYVLHIRFQSLNSVYLNTSWNSEIFQSLAESFCPTSFNSCFVKSQVSSHGPTVYLIPRLVFYHWPSECSEYQGKECCRWWCLRSQQCWCSVWKSFTCTWVSDRLTCCCWKTQWASEVSRSVVSLLGDYYRRNSSRVVRHFEEIISVSNEFWMCLSKILFHENSWI